MTINALFESLHVVEFAVLYLLLIVAFRANHMFSRFTSYVAAGIAMTYGLVDEIHQFHVIGRSFTIIDLVKDVTGVLVVWWFVNNICFSKETKTSKTRTA
ncbi:VanZ family protein [Halobacillus seohaensis]|uniref:VanZ family protein n=1 Tax=Halobacillus seohaensis TaxID=447421 RepID=A0ABW2EL69_9BACI